MHGDQGGEQHQRSGQADQGWPGADQIVNALREASGHSRTSADAASLGVNSSSGSLPFIFALIGGSIRS